MFSVGNLTVYEKLSEICLVPVSELCMYPEKPQSVGNLPTPPPRDIKTHCFSTDDEKNTRERRRGVNYRIGRGRDKQTLTFVPPLLLPSNCRVSNFSSSSPARYTQLRRGGGGPPNDGRPPLPV